MKLRLTLAALVCLAVTPLITNAQGDETLLSRFTLDLTGAWGGWHSQATEIGGANTVVHGGFGGVEFNKTVFVGWAAYKNSDAVVGPNDARVPYDIRYNGPVLYYTPRARSIVHPKFGLQVGMGRLELGDLPTDRFVALQPSVGGELNVVRWFRLGAQAGYRYTLNSDFDPGTYGSPDAFFLEGTLKFGFSWGR